MVNHGQPWSIMVNHGQNHGESQNHGQNHQMTTAKTIGDYTSCVSINYFNKTLFNTAQLGFNRRL
jgi:hypothetical protein